jgi:hypothetical protein
MICRGPKGCRWISVRWCPPKFCENHPAFLLNFAGVVFAVTGLMDQEEGWAKGPQFRRAGRRVGVLTVQSLLCNGPCASLAAHGRPVGLSVRAGRTSKRHRNREQCNYMLKVILDLGLGQPRMPAEALGVRGKSKTLTSGVQALEKAPRNGNQKLIPSASKLTVCHRKPVVRCKFLAKGTATTRVAAAQGILRLVQAEVLVRG